MRRPFGILCVTLSICAAVPQVRKSQPPAPVGRHPFFDVGPPFDFYEVFSARSEENGTLIERITLTPPGNACTQPATIQITMASLHESVAVLLGKTNPCAIPEKDLLRELKRCKKCLVFSGADVVMQVYRGVKVAGFSWSSSTETCLTRIREHRSTLLGR